MKFGWCEGPVGSKPPHNNCIKSYTSYATPTSVTREYVCDCPCHDKKPKKGKKS